MKYLIRRWKENHWEVLTFRVPWSKRRSWVHIDQYNNILHLQTLMKPLLTKGIGRNYPMYSMTQLLTQL